MFRKIHLKLTLLCSGITILILVVMSCSYLYISEKNLRENSFTSFQSDMNTLLSNLEGQTIITHEWLSKIEGNGKYIININDNGTDFLWGYYTHDTRRKALISDVRDYYFSRYEIEPTASPYYTVHTEFPYSKDGQEFYVSVAFLNRSTGTLELIILEPVASLTAQIRNQRLTFVILVISASAVLSLFAFYFTGRLLLPIEKSRQAQVQFVAAASHELRTPLSVILSAASASRKATVSEQERFYAIIQDEGKSMSRLITDLLTLADADSHTFSIHTAPCEVDTLLLNTWEAFEPLAREKGYRLTIALPDRKIAPVCCDAERIRQVLSILLHNAFSHTPAGTQIRLWLDDKPEQLLLYVEDNGPGIEDNVKPHIFERFYRSDVSRHRSGHFGLGLSIASQIMQAHQGSISVSDTPGGGASFVLLLKR